MPSERLLWFLRGYWRLEGPPGMLLFLGATPTSYSCAEAVRKALPKAGHQLGLHKRVIPKGLRHSFATHLLEVGVTPSILSYVIVCQAFRAKVLDTLALSAAAKRLDHHQRRSHPRRG